MIKYVTLHVLKLYFNAFSTYTTPRNFSLKLHSETFIAWKSTNLLGISSNSYIASITDCFLILMGPVTCKRNLSHRESLGGKG